jgi:hypothetical protein
MALPMRVFWLEQINGLRCAGLSDASGTRLAQLASMRESCAPDAIGTGIRR